MKRNLFRTVALISMLSLGATNAAANEEAVVSVWAKQQAAQLRAYINENWEQIINFATPAVLTVAVGAIVLWPTPKAVEQVEAASESPAAGTPTTPTSKATRRSSRQRTPTSKVK